MKELILKIREFMREEICWGSKRTYTNGFELVEIKNPESFALYIEGDEISNLLVGGDFLGFAKTRRELSKEAVEYLTQDCKGSDLLHLDLDFVKEHWDGDKVGLKNSLTRMKERMLKFASKDLQDTLDSYKSHIKKKEDILQELRNSLGLE